MVIGLYNAVRPYLNLALAGDGDQGNNRVGCRSSSLALLSNQTRPLISPYILWP